MPDKYEYYAGMMLIFSAGYFFIKLRFLLATIAGWTTIILFNIMAIFFSDIDHIIIVNNNFFFMGANIIGMVAAYNIEFFARRDFFLNQKLDISNAEIAEANKNLEKKIFERTKELVQAKEIAEQADRLKTSFLANMSHEIRTPMNGILGFTEVLKDAKLSGEEQQEYIGIIEKSGERMLSILNDLIDISKIESGHVEISFSEINVSDLARNVYSFFKVEAEKKGLGLILNIRNHEKISNVTTDKEKIYAIISNLVKNAIKFTHKGTIEISCGTNNEDIEIFVKDTGPGVPKEKQQMIFERFRQGNEIYAREYEGAGLGLSISKAYAEMLGGRLWIESNEGSGSVFYLTIPLQYGVKKIMKEQDQVMNNINLPEINKLNILIAEDDMATQMLLRIATERIYKKLVVVRTGLEAVEACKNNGEFDLIFMDIKMPVMDGYEATRLIREFNSKVVIIAQTAFGFSGEKEKAIVAGCNDFISKPFTQAIVHSVVRKYFN